MSFRASKSGLGYEVQKKLEAVRLQNLYPCNIYRTVTSSLSISFITVYRQKRQCYHCMYSDLINTIIAFVRHEAMCFITLFTVFYGKLRVSSSNLSYVSAKILTSSSRKQIWKNPFKSVYVYLLEDPQKIVRFISNWGGGVATNMQKIFIVTMIYSNLYPMFIVHSNANYEI